MKTLAKATVGRHGKLRLAQTLMPDLFDAAREREMLERPVIRHLVRRFGLTPSVAAVVAGNAGIGGARDA